MKNSKSNHPASSPQCLATGSRGFALVVTLSLMILLTLLAVGLLSLSAVSLRASSQGEAMAVARSNARLALMLALGDLQQSVGPDQRITAPPLSAKSHPGVMGVWESWAPQQSTNAGPDYDGRKQAVDSNGLNDGQFRGWAASSRVPHTVSEPPGLTGDVRMASAVAAKSGSGSIAELRVSSVPVLGKDALAWVAFDESQKARMNLPTEKERETDAERYARLRAPHRTSVESVKGAESVRVTAADAGKYISLEQGALGSRIRTLAKDKLHDFTTDAVSLPVNVADGGLKADLSRAFSPANLSTELSGRYLYSGTSTPLTRSDPRLSNLHQFYRLHATNANPNSIFTVTVPRTYKPFAPVDVEQPKPPVATMAPIDGLLLAPVVTKVQVSFSLVSRAAHGHWLNTVPNNSGDSQRTQMVYLIYTPVVTLYNPYSNPLRISNLMVTFRNMPVAFRFFRNGAPQTNQPSMLSQFHIASENRSDWQDTFSCVLTDSHGGSASTSPVLQPGEARVFGACRPGSDKWGNMTNYLWQNDLNQSKSRDVKTAAGWDYRSGFIVDWLRPAISGRTADNSTLGVFGARPTDMIDVSFEPKMPGSSDGKFSIEVVGATSSGAATPLSIMEYTYGTETRLKELLEKGNHSTIGKVTFPVRLETPANIQEFTLGNADNLTLKDWGSRPKEFAVFSFAARTAHDSLYKSKPGKTHSFVHHVLKMDATRTDPSLLPMEMSFLPVRAKGANNVGSVDLDNFNKAYHFGGTSLNTGCVHYVSQQIPYAPLLNLADLRFAHLASSGHLPNPPLTVGESFASPLLPADKLRNALFTDAGAAYESCDHAWLANNALWDRYFFSGLDRDSDISSFAPTGLLPANPRLMRSRGKTATQLTEALKAATSWKSAAADLMVSGGFNVNSTSVDAWIAVLSSLKDAAVPIYGPVAPNMDPANIKYTSQQQKDAGFPRLARPVSGSVTKDTSADNQLRWSGYRTLGDDEIRKLASAIVAQVRKRGPFLSLAEFVNRRVAPATDERALKGALQQAIDDSGVNDIKPGMLVRTITEAEAEAARYAFPKAAAGNCEEGANAFLSQGDLLSAIGHHVTVRSDTFKIRAYGESRTPSGGTILAKAWLECVVQRIPDFVDPADKPDAVQASATPPVLPDALKPVNRLFGRRLQVVSFRWLNPDEI